MSDDRATLVRRAAELAAVLAERKAEGLSLYRPIPYLEDFHECRKKWRILDGSNRASKTLTGCVEDCRAWLGCDPYGKYPKTNGKSLVVGLHQDQIAMIWAKCSRPGEFKVIKDEHTGVLRAVRPDPSNPSVLDPYDLAYCEKWQDAPPLIPPRMLTSISWEASKVIPHLAEFSTGWRVLFRSTGGSANPPQGDNYDHVHMDENQGNPEWYKEVSRGIVSVSQAGYKPLAIWTATSQTVDPNLLDLREKAEAGSPDVAAFLALIEKNPFVSEDERRAFYDSLSEEDRLSRYYGQHPILGARIYGRYEPMGHHGVEPFDIPDDWCIYAVLDPGARHCGTILAAVDPEEKHVYVYDGFDLRGSGDAREWAAILEKRLNGRVPYAMVCDQQMGHQTGIGAGKTVAEQYWAALADYGIRTQAVSNVKGMGGFFPGPNNIQAREQALLAWLHVRAEGPWEGTVRLQVVRGCCPQLDRQLSRACYDPRRPGKRARLPEDVLVCLEYLAAFDPKYHAPPPAASAQGFDIDAFLAKRRRHVNPVVPLIG